MITEMGLKTSSKFSESHILALLVTQPRGYPKVPICWLLLPHLDGAVLEAEDEALGVGLGRNSIGLLKTLFLPAAKHAGQWMIIHLLVSFGSGKAFRNHRSMVTYVIEATESDSEVVCDLGGH